MDEICLKYLKYNMWCRKRSKLRHEHCKEYRDEDESLEKSQESRCENQHKHM